jgi:hypothetical protein
MLRYPISTLLYLAKINIKDTIQDTLKLHNNIDVKIEIKVMDKNGKIIKVHKQRSHSFVSNFLSIIASGLATSYQQNISNTTYGYFSRLTNGNYVQYNPNTYFPNSFLDLNDGANDSTYGIVVGLGTTPPTPNDYILGSQITNGTGSGQLIYSAHKISPTPVSNGTSNSYSATSTPSSGLLPVSGNTTSWQISRQFTNQSGASITVSEVGLITQFYISSSSTTFILLAHDLLSSPVTVPYLSILQITYTISVST